MSKFAVAIALVASLLAGFAVAALMINSPEIVESEVTGFDSTADINARLRALENAVSTERQARQLLEEEIMALYEEIESLESSQQSDESQSASAVPIEAVVEQGQLRRFANNQRRDSAEQRLVSLTEAGFSPAEAERIVQRESELRMEAMQARYESMRSGEPLSPLNRGLNTDALLREEIGDAQYEMYLQADNRSTAVGIGSVFESSPAQTAGLLPGDEITHYDGKRIFSTFDLTRQTMEGNAGENVVVNITRDGMPMQIVMPRGPLGVNTSRRR